MMALRFKAICVNLLAAGLITWAGCSDSLQPDAGPVRTFVYQQAAMPAYDVLVIVDDSAGIAPYVDTLAAGFANMAGVFQGLPGGVPSLHAAFVAATTSAGACVAQSPRGAACGLPTSDSVAIVDGCGANPSFSATMASTFACLGNFGTHGCDAPMPLTALRQALEGDGGKGLLGGPTPFLRADARLAIVIVTSGDDASVRGGAPVPVQEYIDFAKGLKADWANAVLVSVVAPPPVEATPRLSEFLQAFGGNGLIYPLAVGQSFAPALQTVAQRLAVLLGPSCATGVRDLNPELPGLQYDCTAEDWSTLVDGTTARQVHAWLPSCDLASPPCWRLSAPAGAINCLPGSWIVNIERGSNWCQQFETRTVLTCRGCADPNDPACAGP